MILFFDTETTGLPKSWKAPITDFDNWPRLVQLAYQLFDDNGNKEIEGDYLVKPSGFTIPLAATEIHGITNEKAYFQGKSISDVLNDFKILLDEADTIVAHNLDYDEKIIGCEFLRLNLPNPFYDKHKICTMESSTNFCAINGPFGYKWPKLSELHYKLFHSNFEEAHNAMIDIQATSKCFWELFRRQIIKLNEQKIELKIYAFNKKTNFSEADKLLGKSFLINRKEQISDHIIFNHNNAINEQNTDNMDISKQANWLRGYVDSLTYSDNISKKQIEILRDKLDLLITSIENEYDDDSGWEQASNYVKKQKTTLEEIDEDLSGDDDLPF